VKIYILTAAMGAAGLTRQGVGLVMSIEPRRSTWVLGYALITSRKNAIFYR